MNLDRAIWVATLAYSGKVDEIGEPMMFRPMRVAMNLKGEKERVVALLRLVLEKSPMTTETLAQEGFSLDIINAVSALTRKDSETRETVVDRIKGNDLAKAVELAFLKDLMDMSRVEDVDDEHVEFQMHCQSLIDRLNHIEVKGIEIIQYLASEQKAHLANNQSIEAFVKNYELFTGIRLTDDQISAVSRGLCNNVTLLLGGAGTGITQAIDAIVKGYKNHKADATVRLYAPSRQATEYLSKRVKENVKVIFPGIASPINDDLVIFNEIHDMDVEVLEKTLLAVRGSRVILVGDPSKVRSNQAVDMEALMDLGLPTVIFTQLLRQNEVETGEKTEEETSEGNSNKVGFMNKLIQLSDRCGFDALPQDEVRSAIELYEQQEGIQLNISQTDAIEKALTNGLSIVTGGAGTGVTETVKATLSCLKLIDPVMSVRVFSPTGKSRQYRSTRLQTEVESYLGGNFEDNADLIVIFDPNSMSDDLLVQLLEEIQSGTNVMIVGDLHLLNVPESSINLTEIAYSHKFPFTNLNQLAKL